MIKTNYRYLDKDWIPSSLTKCEIFVFERNLEGEHNDGNAKIAYERYGAEWGNGSGRMGQCYAIPTNFVSIEEDFKPFVEKFIAYVKSHPYNRFILPRIKCEQSNFREDDIITLFEKCYDLINVQMPLDWCIKIISLQCFDNRHDSEIEEVPKMLDESILHELCKKYKYEISIGHYSNLPRIRIRYAIENDKFGYARFGEFFFFDEGECVPALYVWLLDDEYEEHHNQDVAEDVLGDECRNRGYAVRMIFAGVETPYSDCKGHKIYTGDVVGVKANIEGYRSDKLVLSSHLGDYGFPLDNHFWFLKECIHNNNLERTGTVFFQLDWSEYPTSIWQRALSFNVQYSYSKEDKKMRNLMSRFTPNFDQEEWKYSALEILGAEYHWWK